MTEEVERLAETFVKHQINIVLVCFNPNRLEMKIVERFVGTIKTLSADKVVPVEAFPCYDAPADEVERIMVNRVANYKIPKNAPLIIETFM